MTVTANRTGEGSPNSPNPEQGFDLRAYGRVLVRRRWVAAAAFALSILVSVVVTLRSTKIYSAACTIVIDLSAPKVLDSQQVAPVVESGTGSYWYSKEYYETQYKVLMSRSVATRVVDKLKLGDNLKFLRLDKVTDPVVREARRQKADAISMAQGRLRVEPVKDSRIVLLRVEDEDPDMAAELANAFAEAYIAENLAVKYSATQNATDWLEEQLADLQKKADVSTRKLFEFKKAHEIVSTTWEDRQSMVSQRLVALNDALSKTKALKAQLKARNDSIEQIHRTTDVEALAETIQPVANSLLVHQLKLKLAELRNECADLRERYLKDHPKLQACEERMDLARQNLSKEVNSILSASQAEYRETLMTERNLAAQLEETKTEAFSLNQHEPEYLELKRTVENNLRLYDLVLKRLKDAGLAGMLQASNTRILDMARPNRLPSRPNPARNITYGILLGLFLGFALAFVVEFLDTTISTQEEVEQLGVTFLGIIPSIERQKDGKTNDLVIHSQPQSAVAECCRSIRTNLLFMSPEKPLRTILVTSSSPQDGKTITAVSLAVTMANSGNKVLVVDADLRRPRAHRAFNIPNTSGLSSLILGEETLEKVVRTTAVPNLSLVTCGPIPPNPAELLHTETFSQILKQMAEGYDRVIIDSPPVGAVVDAVVIATQVDGAVLVLKASRTSKDLARRAARALFDVNARIFGAVLNDLDLADRRYGYYYRRYGYYYGTKEGTAS